MKMKKRFLGILLALVMVLGLIPGMSSTAYAESSTVATRITSQDLTNYTGYGNLPGFTSISINKIDTVSDLPKTGEVWLVFSTDGFTAKYENGVPKTCFALQWSSLAYQINTVGVQVYYPKAHIHDFTYSADGATITAACSVDGCTLPPSSEGGTDHVAKLTIVAPTLTTYGETGKSAAATLTGLEAFNEATSLNVAATDIKYVGRDGTSYAENATAPTDAGKYTAKITVEGKTAIVDYEIAKAATSVTTTPTAGEITYGQTLADSTLTGGTASVAGTFAWKNTTIAPAVSDSETTEYDVVFTPTDGNYSTAECKVKLTVNKADPVIYTVSQLSAFVGQTLADVALPTADNGTWSWEEDTTAKLNDIGMYTYHAKFTPNDTDNYNIIENIEVQIQVTEKPLAVPATVTANSRTYDGTEKPLVNVDDSTLVGGEMRYALGTKDAATGTYSASIPVATNAGTYYVWYKVVGDANHNDTEPQSVTSTIAKKDEPAPTPAPDPDPEPTPAPAVTVARATKPKTVAYPSKAKVAVSWKAAKGAKSYQLQWRKAGAKKWTTASAKGRSKTVTGLKAGACYEFRVRGANGKVRGKWSAASLRWLKGASKVKAASGKAKGTIRATWEADKAATGGYKVFVYSKRGGKLVKTKTVKAGATSATVKGLKSGKTYYVRVRPYRTQGGSTYYGAISGWRTAKAK